MTLLEQALELCADVTIPIPVPGPFTYKVPQDLKERIKEGVRVRVPFKNRETIGYVVALKEFSSSQPLKPVLQVLDDKPVLSANMLALTHWVAEYYCSSWGEAIENALPKWVKYGKKAERALQKSQDIPASVEVRPAFTLSSQQQKAFNQIKTSLSEAEPKPILLYGVTGSGKSEIYIRAIQEVLKQGKSAICLVPEIALTEQLRHFFLHHFGNDLEILHSKLNDSERFVAWNRLDSGTKKVILGPRSAVFAPVTHLGLMIMDEEHEGSYKQETSPRYHAREVAVWRTRHEKALFVMGTATPSLETMFQTQKGTIDLIRLEHRIDDKKMPEVKIFDLKEAGNFKKPVILSPRMSHEIEANLQKRQGTMLLLNRRGFSTHINCPSCGSIENCISCQVTLTFHQEDGTLLCHYCNYQKPVPSVCSQCKSPLLKFAGFGTEKIESEVAARFPQARIARMDADSVRKKGSHEAILKAFREKEIDILIGTQMIAKGFDFPHVTLVGVILADVGLMLPDFRSAERTFQLLTQVAGRAGRGSLEGRVLIQTYSPHHPSIQFAKDHDYMSFFKHEVGQRYPYKYPPYSQLVNIIIRSHDEKKVYLFARKVRDALHEGLKSLSELENLAQEIEVVGPAPLPFYKLRGHFRWHVMIKNSSQRLLSPWILETLSKIRKQAGVALAIDIDPLNIL